VDQEHTPIRPLDDLTVSRIAAGEVVERPASVVKELLENSLDAGATHLRIEIQAGGRRLIRVSDDGQGIPAAEVALAFQRHATSKLRTSDDLTAVRTLGFRGEALAAIAAVAHVTMLTRAAGEDLGTRLRLDNGQVVGHEAMGAPAGTVVTVENLFNAVPARLKFLKSEATEAGHIHDLVVRYALAYPDRRFFLAHNGRTLFQSPGTGELEDTLIAAYGVDVARSMIPVDLAPTDRVVLDAEDAAPPVRVHGYTSPPHLHRGTRQHITLFVNGRWIHDTSLAFAVIQAYHTLVPSGRFPISVVMVELPPEAVDVNVHPAKTEVRFRQSRPVFDAVQKAVRRAVVGGAPVAPVRDRPAPDALAGWRTGRPEPFQPVTPPAPPGTGGDALTQRTFLGADGARLPMLRVLGQVAQAFIVAEGPDGLYLIDQHAAHERVMYERFMARAGTAPSQRLLAPEPVPLAPADMALVEQHGASFAELGFDIAPFGPDTVLVRALPDVLAAADVPGTVQAILDATTDGGAPIAEAFEARLVRAVCKRASVKAGQSLAMDEMQALVRSLESADSPRTCPHGRPTMIVLGLERLAREFGRT
jgi:DNA mismatch repair protein MutL